MPYSSIQDLPDPVRHVLPTHAQEIYLAAFNNAWSRYFGTTLSLDVVCAKIAWSAVKKEYEKKDAKWVKIKK